MATDPAMALALAAASPGLSMPVEPSSFMWLGESLDPGMRVAVLSPEGLEIGELYLTQLLPHYPALGDATFRLVFEWTRR